MSIFDTLHHVCLVVRDGAATQAYYESIGIGPWVAYPPMTEYSLLEVPDQKGFTGLTFRVCNMGNWQLQLVEPGDGPSPQKEFLETRGEGVFHLGFDTPALDNAETAALDAGLTPLMRGRRDNGSGFTFLDTAAKAGVVLELRAAPKA